MFNNFDFFNEPIDWFVDEIDLKFEKYRRKFKDETLKADNEIINNFNSNLLSAPFTFTPFENTENKSIFKINRTFINKTNFAFERISFIQIPPKRVIFKDFDE